VHATRIAAQMVGSFGMAGSLVSYDAIEGGPFAQGIVAKVLGNEDARSAWRNSLAQAKADVQTLLDEQSPSRRRTARRAAREVGVGRRQMSTCCASGSAPSLDDDTEPPNPSSAS